MAEFDVVVLGAGAAGLMCAIAAGQRGRRVLLLDHADQAGKKILISGGGRCNFTNLRTTPDCFLSDNPHFSRSALSRYTPADFIALVRRHAIPFHEKTLGQLFCDGSARAIVAMLLAEAEAASVDLRLNHRVTGLSRTDTFRIETDHGAFTAPALVLATGGLSIPKMGATGFAHDAARRFGLRIVPPRPGLVPLTFAEPEVSMMRDLAGVSLEVTATVQRARPPAQGASTQGKSTQSVTFREAMLFTHRGLSGPAILQISSYWRDGPIALNLLPDQDAAAMLLGHKRQHPRQTARTALAEAMPQRLAAAFGPDARLADLPDRGLRDLGVRLNAWRPTPDGTEGFAKAEVTLGGVDTRDLSSRTMEAAAVPGLFVIGEAVDVTGWLGGYNFQWAWASGHAAGGAV